MNNKLTLVYQNETQMVGEVSEAIRSFELGVEGYKDSNELNQILSNVLSILKEIERTEK